MFTEATFNYGWSAAEFTGNSPGNMLIVMTGWDLNATGTTAPMPAAYVCDSALNYWYHAGTSSGDNTGSRCSIWVAPNARPVDWVSCSLTTFASSLAYTILEIGNAPDFFTIDVSADDSGTGGTALAASPGLTGSADIGFAVMTRGSTVGGLQVPPAGWVQLGEAQAGFGVPNGVSVYPFWNPGIPAGTNAAVAYVNSHAAPLSAVTVLIEANPYAPVQGTQPARGQGRGRVRPPPRRPVPGPPQGPTSPAVLRGWQPLHSAGVGKAYSGHPETGADYLRQQ
jgi:hypothetical protein